jgi:hypothetical protein
MKKVPFFLLVVTLLLSVGLTFAATPQKGTTARKVKKIHALPAPAAPNVVLYDQYDNAGGTSLVSQDFEATLDAYDNEGGDDFVVPPGETWNIDEVDILGVYFNGPGPSDSFNVNIYADNAGLPGANVYTATGLAYSSANNLDFVIPLTTPAVLTEGTYWVTVVSRMDFLTGAGEWGQTERLVQSGNPAAWQNPNGGFATPCTTWGVRSTCLGLGGPDNVFRLVGTTGPSCIYSNDFNDGILDWIEEKPTVTESGGFLNLTPLKRKAVAVADASFAPAAAGTYTYVVNFTGGVFSKNWVYISRTDKKNQIEVLLKVDTGKLVVKDRLFAVLAKAKADFTWVPGTTYTIVVNYDGVNIDVSVDGTPLIVDFVPARSLPLANTGAAAKNNTMMIDSFCFQ